MRGDDRNMFHLHLCIVDVLEFVNYTRCDSFAVEYPQQLLMPFSIAQN